MQILKTPIKLDRAPATIRSRKLFERIEEKARDRLIRQRFTELLDRRTLRKHNSFCMEIMYPKNERSELSRLCDLYDSDKGEVSRAGHSYPWPSHSYADFYEMLFNANREAVGLIIECGIGGSCMGTDYKPGASLRVWSDYFPQAEIIGLDIDRSVLFSEDRISTYYCDQTDAQSIGEFRKAAQLSASSVDIIVDDGLHNFDAGKCLFENTVGLLKGHGTYVIEDVGRRDRTAFAEYFAGRQDEFFVQFVNLHRPNLSLWDNSLVVVRKKAVDWRPTGTA
jgi:hypothetical protein